MRLIGNPLSPEGDASSFTAYPIDKKTLIESLHKHNQFELVFLDKGELFLQIEAADIKLGPGSVACVGPKTLHLWEFLRVGNGSETIDGFVIHFGPQLVPSGILQLPEASLVNRFVRDARKGLTLTATDRDRIRARMRSIVAARGMLKIARLHVLLELLAIQPDRQVIGNEIDKRERDGMKAARLNSVKRFLDRNSGRPIKRIDAANYLGMEENAFSRFFHEASGQSFADFLATIRIQKAARLLVARRGFPVAEIARLCGYRNQSAFNRQFLKRLGSTPSAFRKSADLEPLEP